MDYLVSDDIKIIREMFDLSQEEFANTIGVQRATINRIENNENHPSEENIDKIYDFAYTKGLRLNQIKEMFYKEDFPDLKFVVHGSKNAIEGDISLANSRPNNDFGKGFYCGESIEQAISFVSRYPGSSLYMIYFDDKDLKKATFQVNQEWMLAVAYYRGRLEEYKDHPLIKGIIRKVEEADYIYAPIADNRMFNIIDQFIDGLITDEQCKHCLAATDLGNQYVFRNEKSLSRLAIMERCYISSLERKEHQRIKENEVVDRDNKVKAALIKYKRKGCYIEEILR